MVKKSIIWTETAIRQRREILKYWTLRTKSTVYAEKLIDLIRERIELVSESPEAGKPTNHLDTREAAMGNFSIYHKTSKNTISIMAFWDNRQNPKKLYKILIK